MRYFPKIQLLHEETGQVSAIPSNKKLWPTSWKKNNFKEYKRFPKIFLEKDLTVAGGPFFNVLLARYSSENFDSKNKTSLDELNPLLKFSSGLKNKEDSEKSRFYPSAGARYPIEIYLGVRDVENLENGVYHYNVKEHALEKLLGESGENEVRNQISERWAKEAQLIIILSAVFERSMQKYQERGYRLALLEAGAIIQNLYLVSSALNLGCCALGSISDSNLNEILDLDPIEETVISTLVIGSKI